MRVVHCLILLCSVTYGSQSLQKTSTRASLVTLLALAQTHCIGAYCTGASNTTFVEEVQSNILFPLVGELLALSSFAANTARSWIGTQGHSHFCNESLFNSAAQKTIAHPDVQKEDAEGLIPIINKYSPVLYLHPDELYFPLSAVDLCTGPHTTVQSHDTDFFAKPVTMETIHHLFLTEPITNRLFFDNPDCLAYGKPPAAAHDATGTLTAPAYVITSYDDKAMYLQFLFLYGFNQPYDLGPFTGDIIAKQNAHEADLEHVTMKFDLATKQLLAIYYASHGSTEGMWLSADHPDITYEGTHPSVFVARGAHGAYPKEGTYVRIYGAANDVTQKGMRWAPQWIRLYKHDDQRFDVATMAWTVFPGDLGKRGISAPSGQEWYGRKDKQGDFGRPYDTVLFCESPPTPETTLFARIANPLISTLEYLICLSSKIPEALPPT